PIRDESATTTSTTAQEMYSAKNYDRVVGASGASAGHGPFFKSLGLSGKVVDVSRYYELQLTGAESEHDHVSLNLDAKLEAIADDTQQMQANEGRSQLIIAHRNDLVGRLSGRLTARGVEHVAIDAKWFLDQGVNRER